MDFLPYSRGMKSLFLAIYTLLSISHCSNIFNNILVNDQLACKCGPPPYTLPASSLKYSFIFNKTGQCLSQPCQLHGYNVNASLLLSVLPPRSSMARDAFTIPLCCLHSTWMPRLGLNLTALVLGSLLWPPRSILHSSLPSSVPQEADFEGPHHLSSLALWLLTGIANKRVGRGGQSTYSLASSPPGCCSSGSG